MFLDRAVIPLGRLDAVSPVYIVGTGRCGSTLLRLMLNRHAQLAILGEPHSLSRRLRYGRLDGKRSLARFCRDWTVMFRERSPYPDIMQSFDLRCALVHTESFAQAVDTVASYYALMEGKQRWGEKSPGEVQHLSRIVKAFPNARIIHITRDPRAQVFSAITNSRGRAFTATHVYNTAKYWVHCEELAYQFRARRPQNIMQVRYEDLVTSPRETASAICSFLGIAFEETMLDTASAAQRYAPKDADGQVMEAHKRLLVNVNAVALTEWRQSLPTRSVALVEAVTWKWLAALGYARGGAPELGALSKFVLEIGWCFDRLRRATEHVLFRAFWVARLFVEQLVALRAPDGRRQWSPPVTSAITVQAQDPTRHEAVNR